MAEETKTSVAETTETTVTDNTPSTDELMAQIAQLTADRDKYKSANDKLSKENAEAKRKERDRMTEEEKLAEAQRIRDEEFEAIKAENNRMKAIGAYKSMSSEKVVENLIEAVSNADHNAIAKIFDAEIEARVKTAQTEWLKSRPQANVGSYSAMTKEQIMAIPDREEKLRAIAQNQNLF
jgi:hypothetical protein